MAEHLVLHCPAHNQAWWESWPNLNYQSDPRCLWSLLERIRVVTRPPPDREREIDVVFHHELELLILKSAALISVPQCINAVSLVKICLALS